MKMTITPDGELRYQPKRDLVTDEQRMLAKVQANLKRMREAGAALSAIARTLEEAVPPPPEPPTRSWEDCCPPKVLELGDELKSVKQKLEYEESRLKLRYSLKMLTGDYGDPLPIETAISDAKQRIKAIDAEQDRLLIAACDACPNRFDCPGRLR